MTHPEIAIPDTELLALLPEPKADAKHGVRIENAAKDDEASIYIYDQLYPWDAKYLMAELREIKAKKLNVHLNTPGGDVFAGVACYNAFVRHPARVVTHVDGVAASIGSVIAMAGDEVLMGEGTHLMIHDPHVFAGGAAKDLRRTADLLDKVAGSLAGIYAARTGKPEREILEMMGKTTWFTADEAVAAGFADGKAKRPAVKNSFDLSGFSNVPEPLQAAAPAAGASERKVETIRDLEAFLRDVGGFSHAAARAIAAAGFKAALDPRDEDGGGQAGDAVSDAEVAEIMASIEATLIRSAAAHTILTQRAA